MSESETSKKITKLIKALDKLLSDVQKDGQKVTNALMDLKERGEKGKDG